ncbi:hypothetical protein D3C85_1898340 [compost metagenome]
MRKLSNSGYGSANGRRSTSRSGWVVVNRSKARLRKSPRLRLTVSRRNCDSNSAVSALSAR